MTAGAITSAGLGAVCLHLSLLLGANRQGWQWERLLMSLPVAVVMFLAGWNAVVLGIVSSPLFLLDLTGPDRLAPQRRAATHSLSEVRLRWIPIGVLSAHAVIHLAGLPEPVQHLRVTGTGHARNSRARSRLADSPRPSATIATSARCG